jgi:hypothetical protein
MKPLRRCLLPTKSENNESKLDPEVFTPPPIGTYLPIQKAYSARYPLSGFGSPTELHRYVTAERYCLALANQPLPLPRFLSPTASLSHAEPHTPGISQFTSCVAPSGFLTLSTPCSPRDLPGLFHPGSAPGVHPSRPSSSYGAVRPLERRAPQGLPLPRPAVELPPGTRTPQEARTPGLGINQVAGPIASMGFVTPRLLARAE